jgi:membrane-bound acyltransferase YfiQ involved in biofilm formation
MTTRQIFLVIIFLLVIFTQTDLPLLILFCTNISLVNERNLYSIQLVVFRSYYIVFKNRFSFHPIASIPTTFDLFTIHICFASYPFCVLKSLSVYNYLRLHVKRYVFVCQHVYGHLIHYSKQKKDSIFLEIV